MRHAVRTLVVLSLCVAASSRAQDADPASIYAKESNQGVYVRDSVTAVEKLALAERMERLTEWHKAADVYQEILGNYSDRVLPSQTDANNRIYQYASVSAVVHERLSRWPAEGLAVYRARYESEAQLLLEKAKSGDRETLSRVVTLYFPTDTAKLAAIRLMDDYFENGDFPAAAWLGDRLASIHPNIEAQKPLLLYRTALCYQLSGFPAQAQARLDELKARYPDAAGAVRGRETVLAETLASELKQARAQSRGNPDSWPSAYGSLDGARIADADAPIGGAKLFAVELPKPRPTAQPNANRRAPGFSEEADRNRGVMTGILPVLDAGQMFFSDNASIYAVSMDSGLPLSGWMSTYPNEPAGRYTLPTAPRSPRGILSQTQVTADSVYAILGLAPGQNPFISVPINAGTTAMVCLDRTSGKENWKLLLQSLPTPELKQLSFSGSFAVVGENIFIAAHNRRQAQFEDCYLLCMDRTTQKLKWSTLIASSSPLNNAAMEMGGNFSPQRPSQIAYSGGRVYILSNSGAMASVDAYSGTIAWLNIYPRSTVQTPEMMRLRFGGGVPAMESTPPWQNNPVIVSDGRVFVLPTDGSFIHVYDAGNGVEIKRIPTDYLNRDNRLVTLVGVSGDKLVAENGDEVCCFNWPKFEAAQDRFENLFWAQPVKKQRNAEAVRGRCLMTAGHVLVPTADRLWALALEGGAIVHSYPSPDRTWDETEGPGNVLVSASHLILSTPSRINVYTDLSLATKRLDAEIAEAPHDPALRLRYAEVLFVADQLEAALARLDEAIELCGGPERVAVHPAGERVFTASISFAGKLSRKTRPTVIPLVQSFFDRAAATAATHQQQVSYRLARANWMHDRQDYVTELKLLQEILHNPDWRSTPVVDGSTTTQAAVRAERTIGELIAKQPELYAPYEDQASAAFNAARASANPQEIIGVALAYPNSKAAPQAMLTAADACEAAGDPRQAIAVLRQLYFRYPDALPKISVLEAMARNYLALPNRLDAAAARVAQAVQIDPKQRISAPIRLSSGQVLENITFTQLADQLSQLQRAEESQQLPRCAFPPMVRTAQGKYPEPFLSEDPAQQVGGVVSLLVPQRRFGKPDCVIALMSNSSISVFTGGNPKPLFVSQPLGEVAIGAAWIEQNLLIWTTQKLVLLHGSSGETLWQCALSAVPMIELAPDAGVGEAQEEQAVQVELGPGGIVVGGRARVNLNPPPAAGPEQIFRVQILTDRVMLSSTAGRLIALDLQNGKLLWQNRPGARPVSRMLANDDFAVTINLADTGGARIDVFDAVSGRFLSRRQVEESPNGSILNAALSDDGKLVYLLPEQLCVKDLYSRGDELSFWRGVAREPGQRLFSGAVGEDQLIVQGGNVYVIAGEGAYTRIYSLDNGDTIMPGKKRSSGQSNGLPTQLTREEPDNGWSARLLVLGSRFYIYGKNAVAAYDLVREGAQWSYDSGKLDTRWTIHSAIPAQDYLLLIKSPNPDAPPRAQAGGQPARLQIAAFSRTIVPSGLESGNHDYAFTISGPSEVKEYQLVNGGFYYRSGDNQLHFLRAAGK